MKKVKTLTAKLVHKTDKQRFYELSTPIIKGRRFGKDVDIPMELEDIKEKRLKPEFKADFKTDACYLVCVSDAHTHIERLVFTADKFPFGYGASMVQIDGSHTFMTHGGDYNSVYPDEVYLRHLSMVNGYKYGGIIE